MISIKRKPYYEDRITKTGEFPSKTIRKLENSKVVDGNSKKSYKNIHSN